MTKYKYTGEDERVIPSLSITVTKGAIIEAPADFNVFNFTAVTSTKESE